MATAPTLTSVLAPESGNYLAFWWKKYPLGHLFFTPTERPSEAELSAKVVQAVEPALRYYQGKLGAEVFTNGQTSWDEMTRELLKLDFDWPPQLEAANVSVVVCTRDRPSVLRSTLKSLRRMEVQAREIIVIDNAPSDNRTHDVALNFPGVRYVRELRPGLDVARNRGIVEASCPIIAYVDDDVRVDGLWAQEVERAFADPSVSAITGLVFAAELETEAQLIFEKHWSFNRGFVDKRYDATFLSAKGPPEVWMIGAGANMAFRKSVFEKAGFFDERLDAGAAGCNGDSEMWFRVLRSNHTIMYNPRAVVHHQHRREMPELRKQLCAYMRGFTVAALIQHAQLPGAGYCNHLMTTIPKGYLRQLRRGFPSYRSRYSTVLSEMMGIVSGVFYYRRFKDSKPY